VLAGVVGGVAAWALMGQFENSFKLPSTIKTSGPEAMAQMGDPVKTREVQEVLRQIEYRKTVLALGLLGAAIAGAFGLGEGVSRRSLRAAIVGTLWGLALGAACGALGGVVANWIDERFPSTPDNLMYRVLAMHALAFGLTGLAAGLATSLHTLNRPTIGRVTLLAGLGGFFGAILYIPLGAVLIFVSTSNQDRAIPEGIWGRLCWTVLAGVMIGGSMALAKKRPTSATGA
jgi:hypothetical protein